MTVKRLLKRVIGKLLCLLFTLIEMLGFLFVYLSVAYWITDGVIVAVGKIGMLLILVAAALSALGLMAAVAKWGN